MVGLERVGEELDGGAHDQAVAAHFGAVTKTESHVAVLSSLQGASSRR